MSLLLSFVEERVRRFCVSTVMVWIIGFCFPLDEALNEDGRWERMHLNLPGFGGVPPLDPPGGLPALIDWVDAVVGEEMGSFKFDILANSLGGLIARELVVRRKSQTTGIALLAHVVDPRAGHRTLPQREILESEPGVLKTLPRVGAYAFTEMAVVQNSENWERFRDAALPGIRAADRRAMVQLEADYVVDGPLPGQRFGSFEGPTPIVAGRQDHVVGFEDQLALSANHPRATIAVLDRAGHNVHLDQPTVVSALLHAWQFEALDPWR